MSGRGELKELYWWNMPVDPSDEPSVGRDMLRNVLVWLLSLIAIFWTLAAL